MNHSHFVTLLNSAGSGADKHEWWLLPRLTKHYQSGKRSSLCFLFVSDCLPSPPPPLISAAVTLVPVGWLLSLHRFIRPSLKLLGLPSWLCKRVGCLVNVTVPVQIIGLETNLFLLRLPRSLPSAASLVSYLMLLHALLTIFTALLSLSGQHFQHEHCS